MSSTPEHPALLALGARKIAILPISPGEEMRVEMSAGCEQFVGRFARIEAFRFGDGIIRFAICTD